MKKINNLKQHSSLICTISPILDNNKDLLNKKEQEVISSFFHKLVDRETDIQELIEIYISECKKIKYMLSLVKTYDNDFKFRCCICRLQNVDSFLDLCGHTFCSNCIKSKCDLCNSTGVIKKLFFV